jgi:GNAT superfamily N-acetyltransferase
VSTAPELTRAGADDAPALARIHLRARAAAGEAFPPSVHADEEYLPHLLRDVLPHAEVWLARTADGPVGMLVLEEDLLADLYVDPVAQRSGVGSALLEHAKALRPGGLRLWVFVTNAPARAFYARHGFVVAGGTDGDNEEAAPDLLLRWTP